MNTWPQIPGQVPRSKNNPICIIDANVYNYRRLCAYVFSRVRGDLLAKGGPRHGKLWRWPGHLESLPDPFKDIAIV